MACCYDVLDCRYYICNNRNLYRGGINLRTLKNFPYKHALVLGLAKSGTAAAILLTKSNIKVRVNDRDAKDDDQEVLRLKDLGVEVITGAHPESVLRSEERRVGKEGRSWGWLDH